MQIDWKHLATTGGYRSLKTAYIHDAAKGKRASYGKPELLRKFQWVINRAKHYAHHKGVSIESILNAWEENRGYWWFSYYDDHTQPKLNAQKTRAMGAKTSGNNTKKPRWSTERKKRGH